MATLRLITIGERQFAVGLWWQVRHSGPAPRKVLLNLARKTARELQERNENYNTVALRAQQFGLGQIHDLPGHCHALAGAIRLPQGQDSFLCIFRLEESLWWVCAISKGIIAADGDSWHETREEAEKFAHSQQQLIGGDFLTCATPEESLSILQPLLSPERPLESLFPSSLKRKRQFKYAALAGAAIALVFLAFQIYGVVREKEAMRQIRLSLDAKARYQAELQEHPERIFPMHWQNAPLVAPAGKQCSDAILTQPLAIMGWTLEDLACSPGAALSVYRLHNKGAAFTELPEKMRLLTAQKAVESIPLTKIPHRIAIPHTALPAREKVSAALYEITQALTANLESMSWQPPEQIMKDDIQLTCPWQAGKFTISNIPHVMIMESVVFQALEYPGLVLTSLVYKSTAHNWSIQGVAYVKTQP